MIEKKNSRGRPSIKYEEEELYAIVYHYRENIRVQGDIKYLQLYKYHLHLHKERPDICSKTYSEDFWRKKGQPGREVIDTVNLVRTVTLVDSNNNKKDIPNVVDLVGKYSKKPDRLISHLIPLENEVRRSIRKEKELKQKNEELKAQLQVEKEAKKALNEQIRLLKECIIKQFHYSEKEGIPLENLLNLNNKNKRIQRALDEAWSNPQSFYKDFEHFQEGQQQLTNVTISKDNIVNITDTKSAKKTVADEFAGRF
ncbi:hypothetical protein CWR48_18215 [Oceanobacillus arenosus]|uniref:Uncharacterized protein n=1 Tax=Oceanobacillus arenosus TaxID=1229153 RepID=A0A3D8PLK6_9BACI|nr:hypothetical protein [Oceanobacillus arenosus]RDW16121.1 hypothetical protein CWR48_18215 [Oceanobacillus arenosus]